MQAEIRTAVSQECLDGFCAGNFAKNFLHGRDLPQRIAVFRALQLGDMLCAVPALRSLRKTFPLAQVTLIGLPSAREFAMRFRHYIDEFLVFPGTPDFPEQAANLTALPAFYAEAQSRKFDLAVQLHGSGEHSNVIVRQLGARRVSGFHPAGSQPDDDLFMSWPDQLPEVCRYLSLCRFLGFDHADDDHLEFPLTMADLREWSRLAAEYRLQKDHYICVHAGARMPSRRWPVERFAEVASALANKGHRIVLTGSEGELPITAALRHAILRHGIHADGIIDIAGKTNLGSLAALIKNSRLLICNDTGVSHVAAAVRARSVVVACGSDAARWAPLDTRLHRVLAHHLPCRPCMHQSCPVAGHPCAAGVSAAMVLKQAANLSQAASHAH
ncbi:MAG TPA: glycosyltransferase family 9 protein [Rhodocyclaceae bacterium]|nr:glycosyltransferase family 9 protein [Rhodocyclaceae bacterium]